MKHITFSLIIRLAIIGFLAFVLVQEVIAIVQVRAEAESIMAEASERTGTDDQTQSLRSLRTSEASALARINDAVVTKSRLAGVIGDLEKTAKDLGLTITISSVNATGAATTTAPSTVRMTIETLGPWSGSFAFLHLLENVPYKSSIEESRFSKSDKSWRGNYALSLTLIPE